ncbi:MAG: hypothetical protein JWN95_2593 [Frankiales bacterium]|nr:hypothetical protein [Frankiales bacterium]
MRRGFRKYQLGAAIVAIGIAVIVGSVIWRNTHRAATEQKQTEQKQTAVSTFPASANTGVPAGVSLERVPQDVSSGPGWGWNKYGWVQITAPNAVIDGLDINGSLQSKFPGLQVKNTRIRCTGENDWCLAIASSTTVTDTEIGGQADGKTFGKATGVLSAGSDAKNVLKRLNIHNTSDGLRLDGGTVLEDSWVHDLSMGDIPLAHSDGIQTTGGANVLISHNRIETGNNCNVFVQWLAGQPKISSYQVIDNLFVSGNRNQEQTSYGVCIYGEGVSAPVAITGNTFSRGWQVEAITAPPETTLGSNKYTDGAPTGPPSK